MSRDRGATIPQPKMPMRGPSDATVVSSGAHSIIVPVKASGMVSSRPMSEQAAAARDPVRVATMDGGARRRAYAQCASIAARHYENFPVASRLLPRRLRPHVAAVYAFARQADDFA